MACLAMILFDDGRTRSYEQAYDFLRIRRWETMMTLLEGMNE